MRKHQPTEPFLWSEQEAMRHTPYRTVRTFREHFGHLYRVPEKGKQGGYSSVDLLACWESWPLDPRTP